MQIFRTLSFLSLILLISSTAFGQKKIKDKILHKKTFFAEVTIQGGKKTKIFSEEISFSSGKIKTKHLGSSDNGGFVQGDYEVSKVDSSGEAWSVDFKGACKNSKDDYIIIEGTVFGEVIDGTIIWETKKQKVKSEMTFTGNLKQKGDKYEPMEKTIDNKAQEQKALKKKQKDELDEDILNDDFED